MADQRRVLVIDRDPAGEAPPLTQFGPDVEVVRVHTMARALYLLREERFDGVFVTAALLAPLRWAGLVLQADEILGAIADGVAVVEPAELRVLWYNPRFLALVPDGDDPADRPFRDCLHGLEAAGPEPEPDPFDESRRTGRPAASVVRLSTGRYVRLNVTPVLDAEGTIRSLIALSRDITDEYQQSQKVGAINKAGEELADLTPEELAELGAQERVDLLKYNIVRHMRDLFGLDFIEVRLLRQPGDRLSPLLTEGMTPLAADRVLFASERDNGVTGFVAATGRSYLCPDTAEDPRYLVGADDARSSLTVPLVSHGTVIGTLNVESPRPDAFDRRDQQFLEIYARSIASALTTLQLLEAEKASTASASVEAIAREVALPLDDIIGDATTVLDRSEGLDEETRERLRQLLERARSIRRLIRRAGEQVLPEGSRPAEPTDRLAGARILVVDAEESVRRAAHQILDRRGAEVETARDAREAVALVRRDRYGVALADIRLPDLDGYECYRRLRDVQPGLPVILMTGFGYDPTHSIVKARKDGLRAVLYKPFNVDRLVEAIDRGLAPPPDPGGDPR